MTEREIRIFGDPVLKTVSDPVGEITPAVRSLVEDLLDSVKLPGRAGVAAAQIGVNLRVFSYNVDGDIGYLINPEILELEGEPELIDEDCLSVPGLWFPTRRYPTASIQGIDLDGETVRLTGTGVLAQAFQHETDHLDGTLYIDRLEREQRREAMKQIRESGWF